MGSGRMMETRPTNFLFNDFFLEVNFEENRKMRTA